METKEEHNRIMEKKSKKSIEKFNFQMIGSGLFLDFDEISKIKKLKTKKEIDNDDLS